MLKMKLKKNRKVNKRITHDDVLEQQFKALTRKFDFKKEKIRIGGVLVR